MCAYYQPFVTTVVAEERRRDALRAADRDRVLRAAGVPTAVQVARLAVGRLVVTLGEAIAGRRTRQVWVREPAKGYEHAPALPSTLKLAR